MAYLPSDRWPAAAHAHRYITREALLALLLNAPPCSHIVVNGVGNLDIYAAYPDGPVVGYLDLGEESYLRELTP
jgi:hypothetical protein